MTAMSMRISLRRSNVPIGVPLLLVLSSFGSSGSDGCGRLARAPAGDYS